jgi:hypothetical protein
MKKLIIVTAVLLATTISNTQAQNAILDQNPWTVGLGWNFIANNGYRDHEFLKTSTWSGVPYPATITIGRTIGEGFSLYAAFAYAKESAGTIVDRNILPQTEDYSTFDLTLKYNLHCFFDNSKFVLQPYILWGGGLNYVFPFKPNEGNPRDNGSIYPPFLFRNIHMFASLNVGIGVDVSLHNIFPTSTSGFCKRISIGLQAMGRWTDNSNDFFQYDASILYKLPHKTNRPQLL